MLRHLFRIRFFFTFMFIGSALSGTYVSAQTAHHTVRINNEVLSFKADAKVWFNSVRQSSAGAEPQQVLINFTTLPTPGQRKLLEESGVTLLDYLPDNTFTAVVRMSEKTDQLLSLPVFSIINTKPEWKAGDYVWKKVNEAKGSVEVLVSFYPNIDAATIKQFVAQSGGRIDQGPMERYGNYKVIVPANKVRSLAQWYGVRYISPVTGIVPLDLQSRPAVKGNVAVSAPEYGGYGLLGNGVTVGVGDNASGIYHIDLKDRITNFNAGPISHHGEHVNGIVGGAAIIDPAAASMAPHVSLLDFLYDQILTSVGAMLHDYNMTITNNSYEIIAGDCAYAGTYDVYSQFLDTLSLQYPDVLHVFASGNDGFFTCSPYPPGFATVGGGYQPAKNIIVVGSMTDFLEEAGDESRGPVRDGRLKPEMVATGLGAYSTIGIDEYEWAAGTSMAAPQVAGGLAVLTERFKQVNGGASPKADVLKAITLNGCLDVGNPGPDFSYGFGVMDIYRSLQMIDNGTYTTNVMNNGDVQIVNIAVPPNTGQLKVMLYWNDVPASPSSTKQLVNDLDLTVKDPSGVVHLPMVPDHTPANVNNNAAEQADHVNNIEQVTINNPTPGNYTVNTRGYSIPSGPQRYVVAYDMVPRAVHLTYPLGGEQLSDVDSIRIFWEAGTDGNTFTVQFSQDNGLNWLTLANNVSPDGRHCDFFPEGLNTSKCLVRVLRNNTPEVSTSQRFSINTQPVAQLDTAQCPGYINIHWTPTLNASSYYVLSKIGFYMQVVDSTADTTYSFRNMPLNDYSYVAVQPIVQGMPGYRSVAIKTMANTGNCTKPISNGDIMIEKILSPSNGRMYTSSEIGPATIMKLMLRDLYRTSCNNYTVSWTVNGGLWQSITNPGSIPADGTAVISVTGLGISGLGTYHLTVAVHNNVLADPQPANDTVVVTLRNLPNDTMNLATPFLDDFESMDKISVTHDSIGVSPNSHWDYFNLATDTGRMRSFVSDDITISGSRSISLDEDQSVTTGSKNTFVGTFNFGNYDTAATEVRVDFDYLLHGTPKSSDGNIVTARGNDTAAWAPLYTYDLTAYPGILTHVRSQSVTDALRQAKVNFSTSSQVSFGQSDTSLIATVNYGNGMTIDNFRIYTVQNDAEMAGVVSPSPVNCGLASPQPLIVKVHNGVNYTLHNVQLFYTLDGGGTFTGALDSIAAKASINYTFPQPISVAEGTTHTLNVWLKAPGDTYAGNDSILNYHFRNSQIVTSYPYLENFESGDGGYYSDGFNNSWQYGTPASPKINKAASGTKAWKTNLSGHYNNLEKSYLYTPCFDISQLTNPMLSVSIASDIENCGTTLCDAAYIEYSFDGVSWIKLGATGQGTNWYDSTFDIWNTEGFTRWHVASIPLPQSGPGVTAHFRFVLSADPGVTFEGLAVDDVHIFDLANPIFPAQGVTSVSQDLTSNQWTDYLQHNQLLASVQPVGNNMSGTLVTLYAHDTLTNPGATQYTGSRSYTIIAQAGSTVANNRLYLLDSEVVKAINDTTCRSCSHFPDAYSLGVTQFYGSLASNSMNGTLADDTGGLFVYHPYRSVQWVPYDRGYYAQVGAIPASEFWFNDGGPTGNFSAGTDYLNFTAYRNGSNVTSSWLSLIDTSVNVYTLERSADGANFATVIDTHAVHTNPGLYSVNDAVNFIQVPVSYYRLKWTMAGSSTVFYSPIRRVDSTDYGAALISFDAQMIDHKSVQAGWKSYIDGTVNYYILERAIGNAGFSTVANIQSVQHYGQQYYYTDEPTGNLHSGTMIHYRLTAVMEDGSKVTLPVRTVEWIDRFAVTNIYPNPTHDGTFTIVWNADTGTSMHITLMDIVGNKVFETNEVSAQWNNTTTVHTFTYPRGVYIVWIEVDGRRYVAKVVYQ